MQWTRARQAVGMHLLMGAIPMALLQNSKQCSVWLGQQYVQIEVLLKTSALQDWSCEWGPGAVYPAPRPSIDSSQREYTHAGLFK